MGKPEFTEPLEARHTEAASHPSIRCSRKDRTEKAWGLVRPGGGVGHCRQGTRRLLDSPLLWKWSFKPLVRGANPVIPSARSMSSLPPGDRVKQRKLSAWEKWRKLPDQGPKPLPWELPLLLEEKKIYSIQGLPESRRIKPTSQIRSTCWGLRLTRDHRETSPPQAPPLSEPAKETSDSSFPLEIPWCGLNCVPPPEKKMSVSLNPWYLWMWRHSETGSLEP